MLYRSHTRTRRSARHVTAPTAVPPMSAAGGTPAFECHVCGAAATQYCGGCAALYYCGDAHRAAHWQGGHGGAECARLAADVAEGAALRAALPFSWADEAATAVEAQRDTACAFFTRRGVHNAGMWRRECACGTAGPFGACSFTLCVRLLLGLTPAAAQACCRRATASPRATICGRCRSATRPATLRARALQTTRCRRSRATGRRTTRSGACAALISALSFACTDGFCYARTRGLPLESVAAVCLDAALSLTHALAAAAVPLPREGQLVVHLIGPRRELDALPSASNRFVTGALLVALLTSLYPQHFWRLLPFCRAPRRWCW